MKKNFRLTTFPTIVLRLGLAHMNATAAEQALSKPLDVGGQKQLFIGLLSIVGHQPLHYPADPRATKGKMPRLGQVAEDFTGCPRPDHADHQAVLPSERPLRRS